MIKRRGFVFRKIHRSCSCKCRTDDKTAVSHIRACKQCAARKELKTHLPTSLQCPPSPLQLRRDLQPPGQQAIIQALDVLLLISEADAHVNTRHPAAPGGGRGVRQVTCRTRTVTLTGVFLLFFLILGSSSLMCSFSLQQTVWIQSHVWVFQHQRSSPEPSSEVDQLCLCLELSKSSV